MSEQQTNFDPERDIVTLTTPTEDDLYDVRREAQRVGAIGVAGRAEIERRKLLETDATSIELTGTELRDMAVALMHASTEAMRAGETERVARIEELSRLFKDELLDHDSGDREQLDLSEYDGENA